MILKLVMKHQAIELYKVYINHVPRLTLNYLMSPVQGQLKPLMRLSGENC